MKLKKAYYFFSLLLVIGFIPLQAGKKPPPIPLKELTNPNSPSYVPYPYPKTEFEIIEDFKYGVKVHFGPKEGKRTSIVSGFPDYSKLLLDLLGKNPSLHVEPQIIKVIDKIETSYHRYYFLLQIVNEREEVVAVGRLADCGLMGGVVFYSEQNKFKPFKTENEVREILSSTLGNININKVERIYYHSTISDLMAPLWKISTLQGIYFVDYRDNVYSIEEEIYWTSKNSYPDPGRTKILILNSLEEKAIFLKKIEKN